MAEKRRSKRYPKRFKVRFGEAHEAWPHTGITGDVSSTGLFIGTTRLVAPGTRLHVELTTAENRLFFFEGVAARQVQVPPELRQLMKAGFGLRFVNPADVVTELVPAAREAVRSALRLSYDSMAAFAEAWERELKRGGAFTWTDRAQELNAVVTVELELGWLQTKLAFEAQVVHVLPEQAGRHGVAFMFIDPPRALQTLGALLPKG